MNTFQRFQAPKRSNKQTNKIRLVKKTQTKLFFFCFFHSNYGGFLVDLLQNKFVSIFLFHWWKSHVDFIMLLLIFCRVAWLDHLHGIHCGIDDAQSLNSGNVLYLWSCDVYLFPTSCLNGKKKWKLHVQKINFSHEFCLVRCRSKITLSVCVHRNECVEILCVKNFQWMQWKQLLWWFPEP